MKENICFAALQKGILYVIKQELRGCSELREQFQLSDSSSLKEIEIVTLYNHENIRKKLYSDETKEGIWNSFNKTLEFIDGKVRSAEVEGCPLQEMFELKAVRAHWLYDLGCYELHQGGKTTSLSNAYFAIEELICQGNGAASETLFNSMAEISETLLGICSDTDLDASSIALNFTMAVIAGLMIGDRHCRDRILRMVSVCAEHTAAMVLLQSKLVSIPCWVFIQYADQLVSHIDTMEGTVAIFLLELVAKRYPYAVWYHFHTVYPNLSSAGKALTTKLKGMLTMPSLDAFVEALEGLSHPEMRWSDVLDEINGILKISSNELSALETKLETLRISCLENQWEHVGNQIGDYNKKFAKKYSREFQAVLDSQVPADLKCKKIIEVTKSRSISSVGALGSGSVPLSHFSQWLANFDPTVHRIELPGLYCFGHDREPMMDNHPVIMACSPQLLVMDSKRKPKRITFLCSDGKEYKFLCKGGEDLRNDERIVTIMELMNLLVNRRANGKTHADAPSIPDATELYVKTYRVVPMTTKVGLIEWVENAHPLKGILESEMLRDETFCASNASAVTGEKGQDRSVDLTLLESSAEHQRWMRDYSAASYHNMFKTKASVARDVFRRISAK